jgi:putative transposase
VRYSRELLAQFNRRKRAVTGRGKDATNMKGRGHWMYLCRAIESKGDTVEFWFNELRNLAAANRFMSKALKSHGRPKRIVIDGSQTQPRGNLSDNAGADLLPWILLRVAIIGFL